MNVNVNVIGLLHNSPLSLSEMKHCSELFEPASGAHDDEGRRQFHGARPQSSEQ